MIGRTAVVSTLAALGLAESAAAGSSREQLRALAFLRRHCRPFRKPQRPGMRAR